MSIKNTLLFFLLFLLATEAFGQAFITTWKTDNPGISGSNQITIPTYHLNTVYSYSIAWEQVGGGFSGSIPGPITGDHTITFPSEGTYRVSITGVFPRIFFPNDGLNANGKTVIYSDHEKILTVEQWGNNVWSSMAYAFNGCSKLTLPALDIPNLTRVTDMSYMFTNASSFNQSIRNWDVSHVRNMMDMFNGASKFNQPIATWNVSNVTNMIGMFAFATDFNQPLEAWDVSNVTEMGGMFSLATSFNQPLEAWNVGNVIGMEVMFSGASSFNEPLGSWNVSHVLTMFAMFDYATNFNQPLGAWDVSKVEDMGNMFWVAKSFNQPIGNWNVSSVKNMDQMFNLAEKFNRPLGNWDVSNVTSMRSMLSYSGLNTANYDHTLIGWAAQNVKTNVSLGADGLKYCAGQAARAKLIHTNGWTITGDSKDNLAAPPAPDISITQPNCFGSTGTITVTIQNASDQYSFDNGLTFQVSNIKSGMAAGTYLVVIKNNLGCSSMATQAVVNPPFDKPALPVISGSAIVCPNVTAVDYSAGNSQYTYTWFISGGILLFQQNEKIKVNWGASNFDASVRVVALDQNKCPTDTAKFPVKIQIQLKPDKPRGMDSVCYNFRAGVPYQTSFTNGSIYTWFTDGGIVSEGQTTSNAKIDFDDLGKFKLWVKEENTTSTDYCEGNSDTLKVTVFKDLAAITMNFVSVDFNDEKKVQIQWDVSLLERISDLVIVSRRNAGSNASWETVATLQKNIQSFLDQNLNTDQNVYEYKVEGFNKCDEGLQTVIHNTIRLSGSKDEAQELIDLNWNDYNGWDGVERYEIWRKLDSDTTYRLIDLTSGDITNYSARHGADGFVHTLKVKAKKKGENTISWSNDVQLDFENPIDFIPNVFTPNGDKSNEYFEIPKLNLYPDNVLSIFNRWGEVVYMKRSYTREWNANGLSNGTYYYFLQLVKKNKSYKGWVQVVR